MCEFICVWILVKLFRFEHNQSIINSSLEKTMQSLVLLGTLNNENIDGYSCNKPKLNLWLIVSVWKDLCLNLDIFNEYGSSFSFLHVVSVFVQKVNILTHLLHVYYINFPCSLYIWNLNQFAGNLYGNAYQTRLGRCYFGPKICKFENNFILILYSRKHTAQKRNPKNSKVMQFLKLYKCRQKVTIGSIKR